MRTLRRSLLLTAGVVVALAGVPAAAQVLGPAAAPPTPPATAAAEPATPPVPASPAAVPVRPATPPPPAAPVLPVRVRVEGAGIDAAVDPVGVAADGQMELPPDPNRLGWYRFGATPGSPAGSAVLAGHVDTLAQGLGQLARLRDTPVGAVVEVVQTDGALARFQVVSVRSIDKPELPLAELFDREGPPRLVLLTCGGRYDRAAGGYQENVVVIATPVPAPEAAG